MTDDEKRRLWSAYDAAVKKIQTGKAGGSAGFEKEYADSYQRLVAAGLAMQIRQKYRAR